MFHHLILAAFTSPINITTTPISFFWMLPLIALIAIIYKTTKLKEIHPLNFIREIAFLFASIAVFIVVTALVLYTVSWLILE